MDHPHKVCVILSAFSLGAAPCRVQRPALTPRAHPPPRSTFRISAASPAHAAIAAASLSVDKELQLERCTKVITADGADIVCTVSATDLRLLRISGASFFDMLGVVLRTLREFS